MGLNKPVDFTTAKLLKEKGWDIPTLNFYFEDEEFKENVLRETTGMDYGSDFVVEFSELIENWNDKFLTKKNGGRCFGCNKSSDYFETFSAPTIADVIDWIYTKYGIWIKVDVASKDFWHPSVINIKNGNFLVHPSFVSQKFIEKNGRIFNSPTEAYESAINYVLNNLI